MCTHRYIHSVQLHIIPLMVENKTVLSCAPTGTPSSYPLPVAYHPPHAGEQGGRLLCTHRYTLLLPPSSCISSPSCWRTGRSSPAHQQVHPPPTPVQLHIIPHVGPLLRTNRYIHFVQMQTIPLMSENKEVLFCAPKGTPSFYPRPIADHLHHVGEQGCPLLRP